MELVQVQVVGAKKPEGLLQQPGATILGPVLLLAGKEHLLAVRFEGGTQALLGIAIGWGNIDVVDAPFEGSRHNVAGKRGAGIHHYDATKAEDGKLLTGLAQFSPGNRL